MKSSDVAIRMPKPTTVCPPGSPTLRLTLVVLSIGAASHFLLFLDSVVDNLLPAATPFLRSVYKNKEDADLAWELLVSSRIYGLAFGCFIAIIISHRSGRKFPVLLGTVLDVVGVLFTLLTVYIPTGISAAVIGRFINGCGQGIVQTTGSVMLAEIPPMRKRGTALATLTMWACMGELLGMFISLDGLLGSPAYWHFAMGIPLLVLFPALYILSMAPESPRYLFNTSREIEGRKALLFYQSPADAKLSIEEIMCEQKFLNDETDENGNSMKKPKKGASGSKSILMEAANRLKDGHFARPLLIAMFVQSFVHLDDWLWISYSTTIFEENGLSSRNAQKASLFMSIPQAIVSIGLLGCFDNFSRRSLLIYPTLVSAFIGLAAILLGIFNKVSIFGIPSPVLMPLLAAFDLVSAAISGESAFAIVPELFLPNDKIIGTAIVGITQNVFGGLLTTFLLTAVHKVGTSIVLIPFVITNFIYVFVNFISLPETGEKTPQEVSQNFSRDLPGAGFINFLGSIGSFLRSLFTGRIIYASNLMQIYRFVGHTCLCFVILNLSYFGYLYTRSYYIS